MQDEKNDLDALKADEEFGNAAQADPAGTPADGEVVTEDPQVAEDVDQVDAPNQKPARQGNTNPADFEIFDDGGNYVEKRDR